VLKYFSWFKRLHETYWHYAWRLVMLFFKIFFGLYFAWVGVVQTGLLLWHGEPVAHHLLNVGMMVVLSSVCLCVLVILKTLLLGIVGAARRLFLGKKW